MAQTKYTYSIANDTANAILAADALKDEIGSSSIITALDYISAFGDILEVYMKDALSAGDKTTLDLVVAAHPGVPLPGDPQLVEVDPNKPVKQFPLAESSNLRARMVGIFNETMTKNTTTDKDWKMPQLAYQGQNKQSVMDGIEFFCDKAVLGDKITFQVIDIDNVLGYGPNIVLDEFGKDWYVMPGNTETIRLYKAKLIKDVYIRVKYTSVGTVDDVKFVCNLFRHMDTAVDE